MSWIEIKKGRLGYQKEINGPVLEERGCRLVWAGETVLWWLPHSDYLVLVRTSSFTVVPNEGLAQGFLHSFLSLLLGTVAALRCLPQPQHH